MAAKYDQPLEFDKTNFPIGAFMYGKSEIHRIDEYLGTGQMKISSWATLDPAEIDVDNPAITGRIYPCPSKPQRRVDPKLVGSSLKKERAQAALEDTANLLDEVAGFLSATPQTVDELGEACPSFTDLEPEARAARMSAVLGVLAKADRAVSTDDGWVTPEAAPVESEDVAPDETPEPEDEPAPAAEEPEAPAEPTPALPRARGRKSPPKREPQPLAQAAAATAMGPAAKILGVTIDAAAASEVLNPTWLMRELTPEIVDQGLQAVEFLALHILVSRNTATTPAVAANPPLLYDSMLDLVREIRDLRICLVE